MTRRKRASAVEKLAAFGGVRRSPASRDAFQRAFDNHTVDQRFSTQDAGFARAIIVLFPADEIKSAGHRGQAINRTGVTDHLACLVLAISLADLVARDPVGSGQSHE